MVNGIDDLAVTNLDGLDTVETIKVCVAYRHGRTRYDFVPNDAQILARMRAGLRRIFRLAHANTQGAFVEATAIQGTDLFEGHRRIERCELFIDLRQPVRTDGNTILQTDFFEGIRLQKLRLNNDSANHESLCAFRSLFCNGRYFLRRSY